MRKEENILKKKTGDTCSDFKPDFKIQKHGSFFTFSTGFMGNSTIFGLGESKVRICPGFIHNFFFKKRV